MYRCGAGRSQSLGGCPLETLAWLRGGSLPGTCPHRHQHLALVCCWWGFGAARGRAGHRCAAGPPRGMATGERQLHRAAAGHRGCSSQRVRVEVKGCVSTSNNSSGTVFVGKKCASGCIFLRSMQNQASRACSCRCCSTSPAGLVDTVGRSAGSQHSVQPYSCPRPHPRVVTSPSPAGSKAG